jgi:hypothetical protein
MKSSFHNLVHFFPSFCNCQFRRLNSIQFLCSQAHIPAGWCHKVRPFTSHYSACCSMLPNTSLYNHFARTHGKHSLYC